MFKRILIANRGEIACRIIRTCRELGVETVAVYSEADRDALHVRMADTAVEIGPPPAGESYLDGGKILEAARVTGAEAIHPGYGFLSENAGFARAAADAGLVFIGPDPETIELMGSKARAKTTMETAGVPLVPGHHGDDQSDAALADAAAEVGYPVMLKAAAGGGGKGMRIVRTEDDFGEALAAARREADSAFGDSRMILERYLEHPRHVEVQVFGDRQGNVVHLFERDCSSQRRYQKIIEEAPAPGLSDDLRAHLHQAAVKAAEAVNYVGAGTVEFLVAGEECFFLEMNTRLQVEHPVTELITGCDLVAWQLRTACGEPLPRKQDELTCSGCAMEARIYAEDPAKNFMPATGRIRRLVFPDDARIDSGVAAGGEISTYYDPMIAKLIVAGGDRRECLGRLQQALARSFIGGLTTNLGFLEQLAGHPRFVDAELDTGFLDRELDAVLDADATVPDEVLAAAALTTLTTRTESTAGWRDDPWNLADGWRCGEPAPVTLEFFTGEASVTVDAVIDGDQVRLNLPGGEVAATLHTAPGPGAVVGLDGQRTRLQIHTDGDHLEISHTHRRWRLSVHERFHVIAETAGGGDRLNAPMPGKVVEIRVAAGDNVAAGDTLAVMEAMKMELSIKAERDGRVAEVAVASGDTVEADALLIALEPE